MKLGRTICAVALFLSWQFALAPRPMAAQTGASSAESHTSTFEPLDHWKAAVLAGDRAAIAALYSTAPPSENQTPAGKTQDPSEEPQFWSMLATHGLTDLQVKLLEIEHPQPDVVSLVLRIEFKLKTSSGSQPFVVEGAQAWLNQTGEWRIVETQRDNPAANPPRRLPEPAKPNTDLYPAPEEAQSEISGALASAAKDHKRVILIFGGNWCYDCHVLDATFHSKSIAPLVNDSFHVVHINIGEMDKNLDIAAKYGVPIKKGVPALAVLDSSGTVLYSQKQGEFENSVRIGPDDVTAFLKKWAPSRS